jgi:hypothetical protein
MEAPGRLQHRTNSESSIGLSGWVSVLTNMTPDIRSCRGGRDGGSGSHTHHSVLTQESSTGPYG